MFKKKIAFSFVDIHSHILYGVDDGSQNLSTSMAMLKTAYDEGIRKIVCTPHYHPGKCVEDYAEIVKTFEKFKKQVKTACPNMRLALGREIFYTSDIPDKLGAGEKLTMGVTKYVLVEYDPTVDYTYLRTSINSILQSGYIPIIAHIERYMCIFKDWELTYELKDMGAVIQVNAGSVIGTPGREVKKFIKMLMKDELVDLIGTDAHSNGHRAPLIRECAEYIIKKYGEDYARRVLHDNAETILRGEYLED